VILATEDIAARDYPFLHLALEDPPHNMGIGISLKTSAKKKMGRFQSLEKRSPGSVWLAMNELEGWTGTVDSVQLAIVGQSGETVRIKDLSLYPASPSRQLRAIYSDFTGYAPWKRANMNTHTGVSKISSYYPAPLIVTLLLLSIFGYGLLLFLFQRKLTFNWTVVALIFLACWICLDVIWQNRLLHQVAYSYRTFSGKDTPEKLALGPDSRLYNFISKVKHHLEESKDTRIFVITSDIYLGMRGAYYLYPYNAFWSLEPPEIPADEYLRSGDYIVLIQPTKAYFSKNKGQIRAPENRPRSAERLLQNRSGSLVRLK
jgi:hypothetical protein